MKKYLTPELDLIVVPSVSVMVELPETGNHFSGVDVENDIGTER